MSDSFVLNFVCREVAGDRIEDEEIKTITYDEYVNAGIPDALLQGLGFAESLYKEPMDTEDLSDAEKIPAEQTETPNVDIPTSNLDTHPVLASVPVLPAIPTGIIKVVSGPVRETVLPVPVIRENSLQMAASSFSVTGSSSDSIVANTPSAVNLVDARGRILPVPSLVGNVVPPLPAVPGLVRNIVPSSVIGTGDDGEMVKYVDENGRVLTCVPVSNASSVMQMVDDKEQNVTEPMQHNITIIDKNGRLISGFRPNIPSMISNLNDVGESGSGNFLTSSSTTTVSGLRPNRASARGNHSAEFIRPNSAYGLV